MAIEMVIGSWRAASLRHRAIVAADGLSNRSIQWRYSMLRLRSLAANSALTRLPRNAGRSGRKTIARSIHAIAWSYSPSW